MPRRHFITFIGGATVSWSLAAYAQKLPPLIGFSDNQSPPPQNDAQGNALFQGFRDSGLLIGRDFVRADRVID
jgi:hypothetical protein